MKRNLFLKKPVVPFELRSGEKSSQLLGRMQEISFQGRNLGRALQIWVSMFESNATIFLGLAGALVPAGMRVLVAELIERRYLDCLVSTGANLFHDVHESLGHHHYIGEPHADDILLGRKRVNRIYDTYCSEEEFGRTEYEIARFASSLKNRPYSTREFLFRLGQYLLKKGKPRGILSTAAEAGVPVYCPAIGDSSIGIGLAYLQEKKGKKVIFDVVEDVVETSWICRRARKTGVIYLGGGTPKNFIQQAEIVSLIQGRGLGGHSYALQITQDSPQWGGLSGCSLKEAQSWGKVSPEARYLTVCCDATIAFPLLSTAVTETIEKKKISRRIPRFDISGRQIKFLKPTVNK